MNLSNGETREHKDNGIIRDDLEGVREHLAALEPLES